MQMEHCFTEKEIKYRYLYIKEKDIADCLPPCGQPITVRDVEASVPQNLKIHSTVRKRIDGLTKIYKQHNISEGDIVDIELVYNELKLSFKKNNGQNQKTSKSVITSSDELLFQEDDKLKVYRVRRNCFKKSEKDVISGKGACVYLLLNNEDVKDANKVYVGYSGNPAERITTWKNDTEKKWWKSALIFMYDGEDEDHQKIHFDIADCAYLESFLYKTIKGKDNDKKALEPYIKPNAKKMLESIKCRIGKIIEERCSNILNRKTVAFRSENVNEE